MELLESRGIEPKIVRYLDESPTIDELKRALGLLGIDARSLMRKNEAVYKELALAKASEDDLLQAMVDHPILIERPVAITKNAAAIGRPPENVLQLLPDA